MVEKFRNYLEGLVGKSVLMDYHGFLSGLKQFDNFVYWENEDYFILSGYGEDDWIYIRKDFNLQDEIFQLRINSTEMSVSIAVA